MMDAKYNHNDAARIESRNGYRLYHAHYYHTTYAIEKRYLDILDI